MRVWSGSHWSYPVDPHADGDHDENQDDEQEEDAGAYPDEVERGGEIRLKIERGGLSGRVGR